MIRYLEFLLGDIKRLPSPLKKMRDILIKDKVNDPSVVINMIKETELKAFVFSLLNYPLGNSVPITSDMDIVKTGELVSSASSLVSNQSLRHICTNHFSPIWKIAAFACDYILRSDKFYKGRS